MKQYHRKRLLKLAAFLRTLKPKQFDIACYIYSGNNNCGTIACAVGWATTIPEFQKAGLHAGGLFNNVVKFKGEINSTAALKFFGLKHNEFIDLFTANGYRSGLYVTPKTVASKISDFVRTKQKGKAI